MPGSDVRRWLEPMKNVRDQLAKALVKAVLGPITRLESNMEIRGHALAADLWVEPDPQHASDLDKLGILGRMTGPGPCLIEPFSGVPTEHDIRSCILKQDSLHHARCRDATKNGDPMPPFPRLWVVGTGSPDRIIESMDLQPMPGWPQGCYRGRPFGQFHLVVARKLPRTPETLLVRLLSRGKTFAAAVRDLRDVPETAPALARVAERVLHVLVVFDKELHQDHLEEDEMESLNGIDLDYDRWKRTVKAEERQDHARTLIRAFCDRFAIELTDERLAEMNTWDDEQLDAALLDIGTSRQWPTP